jgi:PPK2 family polyphosphate:nucleotide phosphotransferase
VETLPITIPDYRVLPGEQARLDQRDPDDHLDLTKGDPDVEEQIRANREAIRVLQERLYAECRQSLLIVLQAMDAGGKDGTIKHVMRDVNPQGVRVSSFKSPSTEELAHDYLWRIHRRTPAHGMIAVFNRSHYEDVLIVRVHNLVPEKVWRPRYKQINAFEQHLAAHRVRLLKLYLHISKDEQKERMQKRLDNPHKHWKFDEADLAERACWDDYMEAYEEALTRCSTTAAPWHVIPANRKWFRNLIVSALVREALEEMDPQFPETNLDVDSIVIE